MPFKYNRLLKLIKTRYVTQAVFARNIGLSERSVSLKLNNRREWKQSEILNACNVLEIKKEEIPLYFFE